MLYDLISDFNEGLLSTPGTSIDACKWGHSARSVIRIFSFHLYFDPANSPFGICSAHRGSGEPLLVAPLLNDGGGSKRTGGILISNQVPLSARLTRCEVAALFSMYFIFPKSETAEFTRAGVLPVFTPVITALYKWFLHAVLFDFESAEESRPKKATKENF